MRATEAAAAPGGWGSSLSFATCSTRGTTGGNTATARAPVTGKVWGNAWPGLFMDGLRDPEQRPRLGKLHSPRTRLRDERLDASDRVRRSRCSNVLFLARLLLIVLADRLRSSAARCDHDPAGLHGLGHLAHERDRQQAILQPGPVHLHVVGQVEGLLERASRDPAMEILPALLRATLLARYEERVLLLHQLN